MKVIIDTNAVMAIGAFGLDIFSVLERDCPFKVEVAVLSGTIAELGKIMTEQRGRFAAQAKLGLQILEKKKVKVVKSVGDVDDFLVTRSKKGDLVLTQDRELKKRLEKPYLTIRQKRKVVLVE